MELVKKIYDVLDKYSGDFIRNRLGYEFTKFHDFERDCIGLPKDLDDDVLLSERSDNYPSDILLWKRRMLGFYGRFKELQRPSGTALGMPYVDNSFYNEYQRLMTEANNLINKYGVEQLC